MTILRIVFCFLSISLIIGCNSKVENPNILFIVVDDLGYTDLSCMGSTYYETPNIDKIANNGMNFTNGYTTSAVCSPSRASIQSGKFTARHGVTDYIGASSGVEWRKWKRNTKLLPAEYKHNLPHEFVTLPEALRENGYKTFFTGKWHLGGKGSYPEDHGFDVNKGGYEAGGPYSGGYFSPFNNPKLDDHEYEKGISLSMKLANETSKFIENNKDSKFLAFLSFYAVHSPIQTSEIKWKKYRDKADSIGIEENGFTMERRLPYRLHQDNPVYAGLIEQVDDAVGSVLNTLKKLNLDKNTIVIFTSDNGGVVSGDNYSTNLAPLRGGKGYQWEGGTRVPYFISVPWMELGGKKNHTPVSGVDFYPTILELTGLALRSHEHVDGISLLPLLRDKTISQRPLYWHYPHYGNQGGDPNSIIREGKWKLIHYWEDDTNELYNLDDDISEQNNVVAQHPDITNQMEKKLIDWLGSVNAKYAVHDSLFSEESFKIIQDSHKNILLPRLEKNRSQILEQDWKPNKDWWGSKITID